jgi:hypothetical protein
MAESSSIGHIYLAKNIMLSNFFMKKLNQQTVRATYTMEKLGMF